MRMSLREGLAVPSRSFEQRVRGQWVEMFGDAVVLPFVCPTKRTQSVCRVARQRISGGEGGDPQRMANSEQQVARNRSPIGRRSREALVEERAGVRCMPQIGSNIYAIGMITALRDYVRLLRAIPMLTLSSHHRHPSLRRFVLLAFSPSLCPLRSP